MRHPEFLRRHADTRCFSLGIPHSFAARPDGTAAFFLRSAACDDPMTSLWSIDLDTGRETLLVDGRDLATAEADPSSPERKVERERGGVHAWARVVGEGITAYATDAAVRRGCFVVSDRLWLVDLQAGAVPTALAEGRILDATLDPSGARVAFVEDRSLHVVELAGSTRRALVEPDDPEVSFGLPEYAASDLRRSRGYWWSPDGARLAVARVDDRDVARWHISNPAEPESPPAVVARPMAGRSNADVSLWIVDGAAEPVEVDWDRERLEYLVACDWSAGGLVISVQSRDQRSLEIRQVDPSSGATQLRHAAHDPCWVTSFAGLPTLLSTGELLRSGVVEDTHALFLGDEAVTPPGLQLLEGYGVRDDALLFAATDTSTQTHVFSYSRADGLRRISGEGGVHVGGGTPSATVVTSDALDLDAPTVEVRRPSAAPVPVEVVPSAPGLQLRCELHSLGPHGVRTALLLPGWYEPGQGRLPVLLDPYGGLGLRKVVDARTAGLRVSQWFAEQGFAVIVADGRGTPGRGPAWERAVHGDIETLPIGDQIEALHAVAHRHPDLLDLERVAIRGWSWGGFLAAAAVLRRPDVFHAAISGAAVHDQRLYHTVWKERQLGHPDVHPERYDRHSLPLYAADLRRPLLLVHGLADDNVLPAHTLRLSAALLDAGRDHEVLLLAGHGHHAIRQPISAYLFAHQLDFLLRALGPTSAGPEPSTPTSEESR